MIYVTVKQSPMYHQMSLEEFLFSKEIKSQIINPNMTNTRTYEVEKVSNTFLSRVDIGNMIAKLDGFNEAVEHLREVPRKSLYYEFFIPKKSRGFRKIDAPLPELMDALRRLKTILEEDFGVLYHTSAFAYIKHRSTLDALKRHQSNESKWYGKYDLSNFFGSTTLEYVMHMFEMIFPFSEVMKRENGRSALEKALELGFLDGVLPQGTPLSPLITNVMMIPVDFKITNTLRDYKNQRYVYTRYADDFLVSSKYAFDFREIQALIVDTLKDFNAPFTIKPEKTRYGSNAGRNWNLGIMVNSNNELTVGYQNKKRFKAALFSYVMDNKNGIQWEKSDVQRMEGLRNYYRMVEKDTIDAMVKHVGDKLGVDIVKMIKEDLRS